MRTCFAEPISAGLRAVLPLAVRSNLEDFPGAMDGGIDEPIAHR